MDRRYSESSCDSWSLVERRSSVESSDEEEIVAARDVYDEYDSDSIGNDSMEEDTDFSGEDSDLEEDVQPLVDVVEEQEEMSAEEEEAAEETEEEEDGEVEQIDEEEALADSAARHFVSAHKVAERFDELADSTDLPPIEQIIASAVATPERMRLFIGLWLVISAVFVIGLERAFVANMNLMGPQSEELQVGLQSRQQLSRIGVAEVREFLNRRDIMRSIDIPPTYRLNRAASSGYELLRKHRVSSRRIELPAFKGFEQKREVNEGRCIAGYANTSISVRSSAWSQCTREEAPLVKSTIVPVEQIQLPFHAYKQLLQLPCKSTFAAPCKPAAPKPTKAARPLRPTKPVALAPTVSRPRIAMKPKSRQYAPTVYHNYSVMRVYQDRSLRRDPKPCLLPSKSIKSVYNAGKVEKKKEEINATCPNKALNRIKKRREQQTAALRKMNKRSIAPPVIYANASTLPSNSRTLMRKSSFAAGHCDRRTVKELRPLPCISYKEQLPCLAPSPRRSIAGASPAKKTAKITSSKTVRSPKKEYIRRIPLV